jgi:8-oxo-dGTP pyrophosphatase MutT (NUDIX family)
MRHHLIKELEAYQGQDDEMKFIPDFIQLMKMRDNCFYRNCFDPGHITGSALLLNVTGDKVLLNHHKIFGKWLSFGGHADGEENIAAVAMREAVEESGISDIRFVKTGIFDVDVHPVAENVAKKEPAHAHFDIIYLLQTKTEEFQLSDESVDLRWCSYEEAMGLVQDDKRMKRILSKWHDLAL